MIRDNVKCNGKKLETSDSKLLSLRITAKSERGYLVFNITTVQYNR
jgi:hypothetical protein